MAGWNLRWVKAKKVRRHFRNLDPDIDSGAAREHRDRFNPDTVSVLPTTLGILTGPLYTSQKYYDLNLFVAATVCGLFTPYNRDQPWHLHDTQLEQCDDEHCE